MSIIGKRIHDARVKAGLSVDELAVRLGKNRATVYRYEKADIENYPISIIPPLANILGVSPAYLMGWTDDENPTSENRSGIDDEAKRCFEGLPESRKPEALNYLRYLASSEDK